jgi:hypothetical protein
VEFEDGASYVWVSVIKLTKTTIRLKVSSRKYHLPDLASAQDIFVKIMDEAQ